LHDILKISVNLKTVFKRAASDEEKTFLHFRFDPDRLGYRLFLPRSQRTSARRRKRKLYQIYPQNEPNYMVTNDDRVKEIVRAINELDVQETTDQVDRMSDSFYYFWIQISDKDIPVELDEDTISINNERYQADTSDLRELLDKTYRDVMSGVID